MSGPVGRQPEGIYGPIFVVARSVHFYERESLPKSVEDVVCVL